MRVMAIHNFSGPTINMHRGQEGEVSDKALLDDLLGAGYVKVIGEPEENTEDSDKNLEETEKVAPDATEDKKTVKKNVKAVKSGEGK